MKPLLLVMLLILDPATEKCFAQSKSKGIPEPVTIVHQLYRDFAWEAVIIQPEDKGLLDQPRATLARYFDPKLVDLILKDRECKARTKEICKLDFSPLWDSQDPGASDMKIASDKGNTVIVEFQYPGNGSQIRIVYQTTNVSGHWRISDIRYRNGSSLVSLLESKE